jgi:hypothetical protein
MRIVLGVALLVAMLLATGSAIHAQVSVGIVIGAPPPPRVAVVIPTRPAPEYVWVEGYWYPVGNHYKWHEGYWSRPPYEGAHWVAPRHDGGRYYAGYWDGDHGHVEHDHHSDKEHDRDYHEHGNHGDHDHGHDQGHDHDH